MISFLRLFARYRALEAQLSEAASARISAEDNARYWRTRAESAEGSRDKANSVVAHCLKQVANFEALRGGSITVPFPEAYTPPPQAFSEDVAQDPFAPASRRRLMREVQVEQNERTRRQVIERRQAQQSDPQAN